MKEVHRVEYFLIYNLNFGFITEFLGFIVACTVYVYDVPGAYHIIYHKVLSEWLYGLSSNRIQICMNYCGVFLAVVFYYLIK